MARCAKIEENVTKRKKRLYRDRCINYKTNGVSNMNAKTTFISIFTMLKNLNKSMNIMR